MKECDLVMRGGTTSGVVYPPAIALIGREYRLRSVGGSSAGAIAATVAAAAEYRRQTSETRQDQSGFDEVEALSEELGRDLTRFLQPSKDLEPLFDVLIDYMQWSRLADQNRPSKFKFFRKSVWPRLKSYRRKATRSGSLIAGAGVLAGISGLGVGVGAAGVTVGVAWFVVQLVYSVFRGIHAQLVEHDFGLVPGTTQAKQNVNKSPAISDWLADRIDQIAGLWEQGPPAKPLTVGDLLCGRPALNPKDENAPGINFAAMTTDLTSQRPFSLPLRMPDLFFFNPEEMLKVIPKRVVDYMIETADGKVQTGPKGKQLVPMPIGNDFPVVLMARMSLSFPILLQTVPLYRRFTNSAGKETWERCLFSDGGISSNLPVHFFDSWLPKRPTFAISLGTFIKERHTLPNGEEDRIVYEAGVRKRLNFSVRDITSLWGFAQSIVDAAKDWQDTLQSEIPGMHERIVTVRLAGDEGGTNLAMPEHVIASLKGYGKRAAETLLDGFNFNEHRYRRALCLLSEIEDVLPKLCDVVRSHHPSDEGLTYEDLAKTYQSNDYRNSVAWNNQTLLPALEELASLGEAIKTKPSDKKISGGILPEYEAKLRLVATPNLAPPTHGSGNSSS